MNSATDPHALRPAEPLRTAHAAKPASIDRNPEAASPQQPGDRQSAARVALLVLAIGYTAYVAAPILIPLALAALLYFLFSPLITRLCRWGIRRVAGALLIVGMLVAATAGSIYQLATPAVDWLVEAPATLNEIRSKLSSRDSTLVRVREASDAVEEVVADITGNGDEDGSDPQAVEIREPALLESVLDRIPVIVGSYLVVVVVTLFLLISGDRLLRKITALGPTFTVRRRIVSITRQIERDVARYLGTVAMINAGLGVVVAAAMYLVGLPNPLLWGAVAAVMNFAPYLGAVVTSFVILIVSVSTFDTAGQMILPPLVFIAITTTEGQIVTPMLVGERMALSPVVVLLSVLVLGWIWGLVGALVAVPLVASARIALANIPRTRPLSELLSR